MVQNAGPRDDPRGLTSGHDTSTWVGWIAFAGVVMVLLGSFHIIQGLVAIFNDGYWSVPKSGLLVHVDYTAWGWVHMILGAVILAAGVAVFAAQWWARAVGTIGALVSAIVSLGFLSANPFWALIMIFLDIMVILALTVHGHDIDYA
jgi:hypothetical protein